MRDKICMAICIAIIAAYFIGGPVFCAVAVSKRDHAAKKRFIQRTLIEFVEMKKNEKH